MASLKYYYFFSWNGCIAIFLLLFYDIDCLKLLVSTTFKTHPIFLWNLNSTWIMFVLFEMICSYYIAIVLCLLRKWYQCILAYSQLIYSSWVILCIHWTDGNSELAEPASFKQVQRSQLNHAVKSLLLCDRSYWLGLRINVPRLSLIEWQLRSTLRWWLRHRKKATAFMEILDTFFIDDFLIDFMIKKTPTCMQQ